MLWGEWVALLVIIIVDPVTPGLSWLGDPGALCLLKGERARGLSASSFCLWDSSLLEWDFLPQYPTCTDREIFHGWFSLYKGIIWYIPGNIISYYQFISKAVDAQCQQLAFGTFCVRETIYFEMLEHHRPWSAAGAAQSKTVLLFFFCLNEHHRIRSIEKILLALLTQLVF